MTVDKEEFLLMLNALQNEKDWDTYYKDSKENMERIGRIAQRLYYVACPLESPEGILKHLEDTLTFRVNEALDYRKEKGEKMTFTQESAEGLVYECVDSTLILYNGEHGTLLNLQNYDFGNTDTIALQDGVTTAEDIVHCNVYNHLVEFGLSIVDEHFSA